MSRPDVPGWMLAGPGSYPAVADDLRSAATELGRIESALTGLLADVAVTLGWVGDAAEAAQARQVRNATQLDATARAMTAAATALDDLADSLATDGARLAELLDEYDELVRKSLVERLAPVRLQIVLWVMDDDDNAARVIATQDIPPIMDRLTDADTLSRSRLSTAVAELQRVGAEAAADAWIASTTVPSVLGVLDRYDVVEDRAERALVDAAAELPYDESGAADLRALLATLDPTDLADLLMRHPGLAQRLQLGDPADAPVGTDAARLAAAMTGTGTAVERARAVADAFAALTPAQQQALALLYPAVVGRLDGAPLHLRVAANRVQISAALAQERAAAAAWARVELDRPGWRESVDGLLDQGTIAVDIDDAGSLQRRNTDRIAYYQRLLYEEMPTVALRPGQPDAVGHQIIYFDPAGDGTIAEMWGPMDGATQNVGIFVPGTSADLEGFSGTSALARSLAQEDRSGQTTTIAWLGSDMPDGLANAPHAGLSQTAGARLRDFTAGLLLAGSMDVTVIGHSYGGAVVGVADRLGLEADRVVHVQSAGAGAGVDAVADYPASGRDVARYTFQAPGDPIRYTQGRGVGDIGHGADINSLEGVTRLETGRYGPDHERAGQMIQGTEAHSDVLTRGSTSYDSLGALLRGDDVIPWTPPTRERRFGVDFGPIDVGVDRDVHAYSDPSFPGAPPIEVP